VLIICPIAIAQHGTGYKITCVCLSVSQCVCRRSYGRYFYSIFMEILHSGSGPEKLDRVCLGW